MEKWTVLITGGARSGKSRYAEELARGAGPPLLYVATAEARDKEMEQRVAEHRKRRARDWITIEEPIEVTRELLGQRGAVNCAVVDCLTFWISNLLLQQGEEGVKEKVAGLVEQLPRLDFQIVLVTNEVGSAVVPDNPLARKFRDLVGWTNQRVAETADEVILMVAGLPMIVKKGRACS